MHGSSVVLIVILVSMLFAIFQDLSIYRVVPPSFDVMPERGAVRVGAKVFAVSDFFGVGNFNVSEIFIPGLSELRNAFTVDCEDLFNNGVSCYSPVEDEVPKTLVGIFGVATPFGIFSPDAETAERSDPNCVNFSALGSFYFSNLCSTATDSVFYISPEIPSPALFKCTQSAYVTSPATNIIAVINTDTYKIISNISVSGNPLQIVISPDGLVVYVLIDSGVSVINITSQTVINTINFKSNPGFIAITSDSASLYVTESDLNVICIINTTTYQPIHNMSLSSDASGPQFIAFNADNTIAYVAMYNCDEDYSMTTVVCNTSNYICSDYDFNDPDHFKYSMMTVAVSSSGHIYVTGFKYSSSPGYLFNVFLFVFDSNITLIYKLDLGYHQNAESIAINSDGNIVYLPILESKVLAIININTESISTIPFTDLEPHSVALSTNGDFLYVTTGNNAITVINTTAPYDTTIHEIGDSNSTSYWVAICSDPGSV